MSSFGSGTMRKQLQKLIEAQNLKERTRVAVEAEVDVRQKAAHRQYVSRYASFAGGTVWVQWRHKDGTTTPPFKCHCMEVEPNGLIVQYEGRVEKLRFSRRLIVRNETQLALGAVAGKAKHCTKLAQESYSAAEAEVQKLANQVQELQCKLLRQKEYLDGQLKETFSMLTRAYGQAASLGLVPERELRA